MDNKPVTQPDEVPEDPYTVVPVGEGCSHCNAGEHWDVVFRAGTPEECGLSTSYGDKEVADDVADLCNDAFAQGIAELRQQVAALTAERDALLNRHIEFMVTGGPVGMASDYDALKAENAALKARAEQAEARCERLESENGRLLNDASVWRNRAINAEEELAGTNRLAARAKEQSYE